MEKSKNLETGHRGEEIAGKYLQAQGYRIIERNHRTRYAEIDLIAEHKGILVFVEVKTRKNERFGRPEENIKRGKMHKLIKNAAAYMVIKKYDQRYRIDAVCVVLGENNKPSRINHYENITI